MKDDIYLIVSEIAWIIIFVILYLILSKCDTKLQQERKYIFDAIGRRPYVYAYEDDGELWYATYQDGIVMMDNDAMKLLEMGE